MKNKNIIALVIVLIFLRIELLHGRISERAMKKYSSIFMSKLIGDNKNQSKKIRECLSALIKSGRGGIRLMDKFGMFIYDGKKEGICLNKTRFFYNDNYFYIFLILEDDYDGQLYTLFLEYIYKKKRRSCNLKDFYFSVVFDEKKMNFIKRFFGNR